jgi:DNA-binding response OmpR family regulator
MRILVIEDDPTVGQYVKRGLEEHRWAVDLVADGEEGERRANSEAYDLIVLDMRLPGKSGMDVLQSLRARGFERPVLVLTAQDAVDAKVSTLRAGADDYVTKPFSGDELLARLRAALRRIAPATEATITVGELAIDLERRLVTVSGREVALTPTEYELLRLLARNAGKLLTHPMILREIWGPAYREESNYLHVYVSQLRRKIEPDPARPRYILTQPGVGYRLADEHFDALEPPA